MSVGGRLSLLGLGAIAVLSHGLIAKSALGSVADAGTQHQQPSQSSTILASTPATAPTATRPTEEDLEDPLKYCAAVFKDVNQNNLENRRVELFYYRNAENVVNLINRFFFEAQRKDDPPTMGASEMNKSDSPTEQQDPKKFIGCAAQLPVNSLVNPVIEDNPNTDTVESGIDFGRGVGQGGGNVILLRGDEDYVKLAHQLIAPLDLPLPGIDLQLWGVQISSDNPDKLAKVMVDVRGQISQTQQLVQNTFRLLQLEAQETLSLGLQYLEQEKLPPDIIPLDPAFLAVANSLGYRNALSSARRLSILDIFLVGKVVKDPAVYYNALYNAIVDGKMENGRFVTSDKRLQPYYDIVKQTGRPPFERVFRSQGLKPKCEAYNPDNKCEMWTWVELYPDSVTTLANANRITTLEFAFHYADFSSSPRDYNPAELQRTSEVLNSEVRHFTNLLQQDIEELFVRPTLTNVQQRVSRSRSVSFAQVGRTTIATLSGVKTDIISQSENIFDVPEQQQTFEELLKRARLIQNSISPFIPNEVLGASALNALVGEETRPITTIGASVGPLPLSGLIGLIAAFSSAQGSTPTEITTGINLSFTPGVLRDLNSAELNIDLKVGDPAFSSTADENAIKDRDDITRVGIHEVQTTVYTQALDFFDLSTFTNQATLSGGRAYFPVVGQLWRAIFGDTPVLGDLFSYQRGPQTVLHESLLLTNSFITPTSLGLGLLYPISDESFYRKGEYCVSKVILGKYLESLGFNSTRLNTPNSYERLVFEMLSNEEKQRYLAANDRYLTDDDKMMRCNPEENSK